MSQLSTKPAQRDAASIEVCDWPVDVTPWLLVGETIASAAAVIRELDTGVDVSATCLASSTPSIVGTILTTRTKSLTSSKSYRLAVNFTLSSGRRLAYETRLDCVF